MIWKPTRLDRTESHLLLGLIFTFIADVLSTIFFVYKGLGNQEANMLVYQLGWLWGGALSVFFNILVFYILLIGLQNSRIKNKMDKRYSWVATISMLVVFRFLVVINNVYFALTQPSTLPDLAPMDITSFWIMITGGLYVVYYLLLFAYDAFTMTSIVQYNPDAYRLRITFRQRIANSWLSIKSFFGGKHEQN